MEINRCLKSNPGCKCCALDRSWMCQLELVRRLYKSWNFWECTSTEWQLWTQYGRDRQIHKFKIWYPIQPMFRFMWFFLKITVSNCLASRHVPISRQRLLLGRSVGPCVWFCLSLRMWILMRCLSRWGSGASFWNYSERLQKPFDGILKNLGRFWEPLEVY